MAAEAIPSVEPEQDGAKLRSASYMIERDQFDYVNELGKRFGMSASLVVREIIRTGGPLFEQDMTALQRRRAAREAAV
jgi:hypothetical protein